MQFFISIYLFLWGHETNIPCLPVHSTTAVIIFAHYISLVFFLSISAARVDRSFLLLFEFFFWFIIYIIDGRYYISTSYDSMLSLFLSVFIKGSMSETSAYTNLILYWVLIIKASPAQSFKWGYVPILFSFSILDSLFYPSIYFRSFLF